MKSFDSSPKPTEIFFFNLMSKMDSSDGNVTLKLRYVLQTMNYNSVEALLRSLLWCEKKHVTYDVQSSNCFVAGMNHLTGSPSNMVIHWHCLSRF